MHLLSEPFPPTRRGMIRSTPARSCLLYVYAHDRNTKIISISWRAHAQVYTSRSQKRKDSEMYNYTKCAVVVVKLFCKHIHI